MTQFKGKAIYNPSGKAGEYSYWACNFYVGCSNGCQYCYCKKGILAKVMGQNAPQLKQCFKNEGHALEIFEKELIKNEKELQKHGLFFSFTTDPMLPDTVELTSLAVQICNNHQVPVKILTKRTDSLGKFIFDLTMCEWDKSRIAIGFTLTGHNELETGASTNLDRIKAMESLSKMGFKTFASIEPIIDFQSSFKMVAATEDICNLYKIGLQSGKTYLKDAALLFLSNVIARATENNSKVYFKDSFLKCSGKTRESMKQFDCCVDRDYNIFKSL